MIIQEILKERNPSFNSWSSLPANQTIAWPYQVILKLPLGVEVIIDVFIHTDEQSTWKGATAINPG